MREVQEMAHYVGLYVSTYSPGDGVTRYRFFTTPTDYFAGSGIATCLGRRDAILFLTGYRVGREHGLNQACGIAV